jgi:HlyD family secretion protein
VKKTFLILPIAAAIAGGGYYRWRPAAGTPGEILLTGFVEGEEKIVRSEVAGRVLAVHVREGDAVEKGTLLVEIDPRDAQSRRRQQELAIESLKAKIAQQRETVDLVKAQVPQAIAAAEAELARAEAQAHLAETNVQRERELVANKTHAVQALDDAETQLKALQAAVAGQKAAVALAMAREREIKVAEATLRTLEAGLPIEQEKLHELDLLLEKHAVRADAPGTVQAKLVNPGELAQPGKALVSLLDEDDKYVRIYIPVPDLSVIHVHTQVEVELDFLPGSRVAGEVDWIESQAAFTPRVNLTQDDRVQQVYQARVKLAPGAARTIKAGAEANVHVHVGAAGRT